MATTRPHGHRIRSAAAASTVGDTAFGPVTCGPRAHRPVENRPTAHGARLRTARCGLGCGRGQLATHSSPVRWPRLRHTVTVSGRRLWLRTVGDTEFDSRGARPARSSPRGEPADRPRTTRTCTARCGLGCGAGQLATRSSPVRWPRLGRTATASGRRLRLQIVGDTATPPRLNTALSKQRGADGCARSLVRCWCTRNPVHATADTNSTTLELAPARSRRAEPKAPCACLGPGCSLISLADARATRQPLSEQRGADGSARPLVRCWSMRNLVHATADTSSATLKLAPARSRRAEPKAPCDCLRPKCSLPSLTGARATCKAAFRAAWR